MSDIALIRPGCTDFDEQHRIQGALDLPLNDIGETQVGELIDQLRDMPLAVIYASPGEPAQSTARSIAEELDVRLKSKEELRNLDQGLWQGLQEDDVRRKFPKAYKQWHEIPESVCPPEGETVAHAVDRIRKVLAKPLKKGVSFAVVCSEPLATLVSCVLRNQPPCIPDKLCTGVRAPLVERLHVNGAGTVEAVNGDAIGGRG